MSASPAPLRIERSHRLVGVFGVMHAGAAICAWAAPIHGLLSALLVVAVAFSAQRSIRLHALRTHAQAIVALEENGGVCYCRRRSGEDWDVCGVRPLFLHPQLTLLQLTAASGRRSTLVIARDAVDPDSFRDWRRHFAWGRGAIARADGTKS